MTIARRRRHPLTRLLAAAFVATVVVGTSAADARSVANPSLGDLQSQRSKVRSEKADAASELDTLNADEAQITAALADLRANVATQASRVEEARRAVAQAEAEEAASVAAEAAAQAELDSIRVDLKRQAVEAYVSSPVDETMEMLSAKDISDALNKRTVLQMQASRNLDSVERYRTIQEDLAVARAAAVAAAERADAKRADVEARMGELQDAQAQQEDFAAQIESRIEAQLAEASALESLDANLSGQINSEQTRLAKELAAQQAAARARAAAAGASRASASGGGRSSGGGSGSGGGGGPSLPSSGGNGIVSVRGIRVDSSIAGALESMLAAAEADGIVMSGGGYRDPAGQIAVRRNNCGSSNYAIYEMPASSCSPPTARPGQSMHEQGLAIDFTQNGRTLNRSSPAYGWLKANAGAYGFKNLPSEPWHWSTNGR